MTLLDLPKSCCSDRAEFISVEAARSRALQGVNPVTGEEVVGLRAARGRVNTSGIAAGHALPPFDQSAMDGYAVRTGDFSDGSIALPVVARQPAGPALGVSIGEQPAAVRIFTGAPIPPGFDAVVMQEHCEQHCGSVTVPRRPEAGQHIRVSGDDVPAGALIVPANTLIDARHVAILAAAGVPSINVRRRVRVAVLSTGDELREPDQQLRPGEIHDSNRAMLLSLLERPAVELVDLGRIPDDPASIAKAFEAAARDFDIVISSGGVSVGEEDHIRTAVFAAGGEIAPLNASIKPGKPISIGRLGTASLVGLPGNPVSALVTFLWFAQPIIVRRMGLRPEAPRATRAVAAFAEQRRPGRDEFVPVVVAGRDREGRLLVERRQRAGSARLSSLIDADGLARIPGELSAVRSGDTLDLYTFDPAFSL
ncbi:MAG: molybdopterin molybdotransferase MoeA [Bradyrhizobium sp.]|uniref:molybdopterin molybdotransferase MoeA n=1 Tax=Bradyrhizobium sp. TaxID=376 RepID=UPI0025C59E0A|nr:gephyrin-like molybdotransferase Glp [Bradyrhizobium sp.]MBI5262730.1 molybdopterin molybdotransferase MoeA [Bradyrhizobium sp.]